LPTGIVGSPFQSTVHDPGFAVCRNASVRNFAPEAFAVAARVSVVLK
jgi:hypothetical protein